MSAKIPFVVTYVVTDGSTYSSYQTVPVMAESKEAFLSDFELAMAAYDPDGVAHFSICDHVFEYPDFIEWSSEQITPRRVKETYEAKTPEILTIDEWILSEQRASRYKAELCSVNVVADGQISVAKITL